eukprot:3084404-Rhodomonas_salina.1
MDVISCLGFRVPGTNWTEIVPAAGIFVCVISQPGYNSNGMSGTHLPNHGTRSSIKVDDDHHEELLKQ